ncbi:LysE family translocator [Undibacter mobilis]|uniref:LysE family translocator n=1 Tax=Undibacter mobilis TaxID=2292256 RepID=A0A371BCV6_9BRAD|nr:LysE family translocator [Undibacter mobilis]RDV05233.1 LysE family translocator [Undibacter mobilis]
MVGHIHLSLIMVAALIAVASPGPAVLAIAGTSMRAGRRTGLVFASGVTTGSLIWSVGAAAGLSAVMLANAWLIELIRYFGAAYLLWLAAKSARSALTPGKTELLALGATSLNRAYGRGLVLHLTNPKAILFFGSLYSFGVPADATLADLALIVAAVGLQSAVVLHGYAILFSNPTVVAGYLKLRRWFDGLFAVAFGYAGFRILTAKL